MMSDGQKAYTILLVDDQRDVLQPMAELLVELGQFRVITAEDGAQGLLRFEETQPDCVVIDVKMPNLNGYQMVRALRGDPRSAQTPLIILSALNQEKDALAGLLSGADRYLTKPVTPTELIAVIEEVMALDPQQRQRFQQRLVEDDER